MLAEGVDLEQVDDAARFLGVHTKDDPKTRFVNMRKKDLIKCVLEILGLDVRTANVKYIYFPKRNHLPNLCLTGLILVISPNTGVCLECSCILLVTHVLTSPMLLIVLHDVCFAQSLYMNMPPSKLVAI